MSIKRRRRQCGFLLRFLFPLSPLRGAWPGIAGILLLGLLLFAGCDAEPAPPNLLLITIDTLRYDRLGCTGCAQARTPHLDRLAGEGVIFDNCVVSVPITLPSHGTIMTGMLPFELAVRRNEPYALGKEAVTLAEILARAGYATRAVVAGEPLAPGCGLEQGFHRYSFKPGPRASHASLLESKADETTSFALNEAKDLLRGKPYFFWIHYFDPHDPYAPPPHLAGRAGTPLDRAYNGEVTFVDQEIGRLLRGLEKRGLLAETYVLVTADHGEGLGDHGEATHAFFVYDSTVRVPLIVKGPGIEANRTCATQVRSQDLMATCLQLLGVEPPADQGARGLTDFLLGRAAEFASPPAFTESVYCHDSFQWAQMTAWRETDHKLIQGSKGEYFDLAGDPRELEPLPAGADGEQRERFARLLTQVRAQARQRIEQGPQIELDLPGYFGGRAAGSGLFLSPDRNRTLPHPPEMSRLLDELLLGIAQTDGGQFNRARGILEKVVQGDPGNPTARFWLGRATRGLAEKEGNLDLLEEARAHFEKVLEIDAEHTKAFQMSTWCLIQAGAFVEAQQRLEAREQAGRADAKHWELQGFLLATRSSAGRSNPLFDPASAFDAFGRCLGMNQNQPDLLEKLTGLARSLGRSDREKEYKKSLQTLSRNGWK